MTVLRATLERSVEEAMTATTSASSERGYTLAERGPSTLVFKKGMRVFSWGSSLTVRFEAASATQTRLTITTSEVLAITDWGRGKRAAVRLLDAVGAEIPVMPSFYCRTCRGIFWSHSASCAEQDRRGSSG